MRSASKTNKILNFCAWGGVILLLLLSSCRQVWIPFPPIMQPDKEPVKWNGTSDITWYNENASAFNLDTPEELAGLSELASKGNTFEGKTIYLLESIDLSDFEWNPIGEYWQFDLYDISTGNQLLNKQVVYSITFPYNNIISAFRYKEIGSLYVVNLNGTSGDKPNYENLGSEYSLIWGDTPNETVS